MNGILKFEFALEKHQKRLKAKLNKFNFPLDKKYEMDDVEAFDEYQTNLIKNNARLYNTEERKMFNTLNQNLQDIINIKTECFTNGNTSSVPGTVRYLPFSKVQEESYSSDSMNHEEIMDKYNKILFYNEEHKLIDHKNLPLNALPSGDDIAHNGGSDIILSDNFSHISPLITHNENKRKKLKKLQIYQNENNGVYISRHDSFTLPRTTSKLKMYKYK